MRVKKLNQSVKVVTRAQTLKDANKQMDGEGDFEKSSQSSWKACCQRRMDAKKHREEESLKEQKK